MIPIEAFRLEAEPASVDAQPVSRIMHGAQDTGLLVNGVDLEAQFQCGLGYLLLITEDTPYEEALHITLISADFDILDHLELSLPYTPGVLRELKAVEENQLTFIFLGDQRWVLKVLPRATRWPIGHSTRGVNQAWRRILKQGYLDLIPITRNR